MCGPAQGHTNLTAGMGGIQEDFSEEVRPKVVVEGPLGRALRSTLLKDPGQGVAGDSGRKAEGAAPQGPLETKLRSWLSHQHGGQGRVPDMRGVGSSFTCIIPFDILGNGFGYSNNAGKDGGGLYLGNWMKGRE